MNSKEFKGVFGGMAKMFKYKKAFGGWYKESPECLGILTLQKSKFGDYYQLLIKIFIQGAFDRIYVPDDQLIKSAIGHITINESTTYRDVLNFDEPMDDLIREERLAELFENHINPFINKALLKSGIKELVLKGEISLLSSVKAELKF